MNKFINMIIYTLACNQETSDIVFEQHAFSPEQSHHINRKHWWYECLCKVIDNPETGILQYYNGRVGTAIKEVLDKAMETNNYSEFVDLLAEINVALKEEDELFLQNALYGTLRTKMGINQGYCLQVRDDDQVDAVAATTCFDRLANAFSYGTPIPKGTKEGLEDYLYLFSAVQDQRLKEFLGFTDEDLELLHQTPGQDRNDVLFQRVVAIHEDIVNQYKVKEPEMSEVKNDEDKKEIHTSFPVTTESEWVNFKAMVVNVVMKTKSPLITAVEGGLISEGIYYKLLGMGGDSSLGQLVKEIHFEMDSRPRDTPITINLNDQDQFVREDLGIDIQPESEDPILPTQDQVATAKTEAKAELDAKHRADLISASIAAVFKSQHPVFTAATEGLINKRQLDELDEVDDPMELKDKLRAMISQNFPAHFSHTVHSSPFAEGILNEVTQPGIPCFNKHVDSHSDCLHMLTMGKPSTDKPEPSVTTAPKEPEMKSVQEQVNELVGKIHELVSGVETFKDYTPVMTSIAALLNEHITLPLAAVVNSYLGHRVMVLGKSDDETCAPFLMGVIASDVTTLIDRKTESKNVGMVKAWENIKRGPTYTLAGTLEFLGRPEQHRDMSLAEFTKHQQPDVTPALAEQKVLVGCGNPNCSGCQGQEVTQPKAMTGKAVKVGSLDELFHALYEPSTFPPAGSGENVQVVRPSPDFTTLTREELSDSIAKAFQVIKERQQLRSTTPTSGCDIKGCEACRTPSAAKLMKAMNESFDDILPLINNAPANTFRIVKGRTADKPMDHVVDSNRVNLAHPQGLVVAYVDLSSKGSGIMHYLTNPEIKSIIKSNR